MKLFFVASLVFSSLAFADYSTVVGGRKYALDPQTGMFRPEDEIIARDNAALAKQAAAEAAKAQREFQDQWNRYQSALGMAQFEYDAERKDHEPSEIGSLKDQIAAAKDKLASLTEQNQDITKLAKRERRRLTSDERATIADNRATMRELNNKIGGWGRDLRRAQYDWDHSSSYPAKVADVDRSKLPTRVTAYLDKAGSPPTAPGPTPTQTLIAQRQAEARAPKTRAVPLPQDLRGLGCSAYAIIPAGQTEPKTYGYAPDRAQEWARYLADQVVTCQFPPAKASPGPSAAPATGWRLDQKAGHLFAVQADGKGFLIKKVTDASGLHGCLSSGTPCRYVVADDVMAQMREKLPQMELRARTKDRRTRTTTDLALQAEAAGWMSDLGIAKLEGELQSRGSVAHGTHGATGSTLIEGRTAPLPDPNPAGF